VADGLKSITVSVWYRERMALPPGAEIRVSLEDVARMDVRSDVIATARFSPQTGPPWEFTLEYDAAKIHDRGRYSLRVRIEVDGSLMFISTENIPAFDRADEGPVKILVSRVGGSRARVRSQSPKPEASLKNTYWKIIEINGQSATLGAGQRELNMALTEEGRQARGFSGCNKFTGRYEMNDNQLQFIQMASTNMACMTGMEQERRFLDALMRTKKFSINGESLSLYDDED
jgi:putative lipoprotein